MKLRLIDATDPNTLVRVVESSFRGSLALQDRVLDVDEELVNFDLVDASPKHDLTPQDTDMRPASYSEYASKLVLIFSQSSAVTRPYFPGYFSLEVADLEVIGYGYGFGFHSSLTLQ